MFSYNIGLEIMNRSMQSMKLTIVNKIVCSFLVMILIMIVVAGISIRNIYRIINESDSILVENSNKDDILIREVDHLKMVKGLSEYISKLDEGEYLFQTNDEECEFGLWLSSAKRKSIENLFPETKQLLDAIEDPHRNLHKSFKDVKNKLEEGKISEALDVYHLKTNEYLKQTEDIFKQIVAIYDNGIYQEEAMIKADRRKAIAWVVTFCVGATLLAIIFAIMISRNIAKRIDKGLKVVDTISKGDLRATFEEIKNNRNDEIDKLLNAFVIMKDKLSEVVISVVNGSNNLASASLQIRSASQQLSVGSSKNTTRIEDVSCSMEQITSTIKQNQENVRTSEKQIYDLNERILRINSKLQRALTTNKEIADKISVISDIATKTNIIALNAAIQAVQNGSKGSGFSVVAAEVQKLANSTKAASVKIIELTQSGLAISEECSQNLEDLLPSLNSHIDLIQEINVASKEQFLGVDQVNSAMQELNYVSEQNAASSEQLAASSEEMNSLATQMKQLVSFFKVDVNKD